MATFGGLARSSSTNFSTLSKSSSPKTWRSLSIAFCCSGDTFLLKNDTLDLLGLVVVNGIHEIVQSVHPQCRTGNNMFLRNGYIGRKTLVNKIDHLWNFLTVISQP